MIVFHDLSSISQLPTPLALTIGNFDGLHLGHQYLLKEVKKRGSCVVVTFSNHSSEILSSKSSLKILFSLEKKLLYLEKYGVDYTIVFPFTQQLAQTSYDQFLKQLREKVPFSSLVLGEGSRIGKDGKGDKMHIQQLANQLKFEAIYLPKLEEGLIPISSKRIRQLIEEGDRIQVEKILGRDANELF